ncbi:hypothetical protein IEQ34_015257 [Dendrobium chrysotoxum]|uniref:Uncharacterized protein n=1 Tax=Dendrobium chrysotoxum TaxID=161865 RepID=A0AAV7GHH8_DENCH|nr:hypothetical protein IEQ34_015257 [Dendrobium chrysotoxum]
MSVVVGLIVFFRDHRVVLFPEWLSQMGHFICDTQGHISFRSNLLEKWGKFKELPIPFHVGAEDLLKMLKLSDVDTLHYEVRYLRRYMDEKYLFKVVLSTHVGRSHAHMLKKSSKVP